MTNISRDPLLRAIYDATQAIEACGASEALTAAVMAVTAIYQHAERVLDERGAALARAEAAQYTLPWTPEETARRFHEAYEALAPLFDYRTRIESSVPWERVPDANKKLMIATVRLVLIEQAIDAARAKKNNNLRHVCGESGYNGMIDQACPACEQSRARAEGER